MQKTKKLIILGAGPMAEAVCESFRQDSPYEVLAFSVEKAFLKQDRLLGLPVLPFEEVQAKIPPSQADFFAAMNHASGNALRRRFFAEAKARGYAPASYVSTKAHLGAGATLGAHAFVGDFALVEAFARLGDNVVLWHGSQVGHHSVVEDHCFLLPKAVMAGACRLGEASVLGTGAALEGGASIPPGQMIPGPAKP